MKQKQLKGWLYLLPAIVFLGVFMVYPLIDVVIYAFEEGYNFVTQTSSGTGVYNFRYVLHDPYFVQALRNTFIIVIITVPVSTGLALLISLALNSIKPLRNAFQTIYFLLAKIRENQLPVRVEPKLAKGLIRCRLSEQMLCSHPRSPPR